MIQAVYQAGGGGQVVAHEYQAAEFYQAFCDWRETQGETPLALLKSLIDACPADCVVGNGYAAVMPLFAERFGRTLTVVHLRRADRDACIRSLIENCELFPYAYKYYSTAPQVVWKRMAAFHFDEMTQAEWDRLRLSDKIAWYYDKTHELLDEHRCMFDKWVDITTESLDSPDTRRMIAQLVAGADAAPPPPVHVNLHKLDLSYVSEQQRSHLFWLLRDIDPTRVCGDHLYLLQHVQDRLVALTDWSVHGRPIPFDPGPAYSPAMLAQELERLQQMVGAFSARVSHYQGILRERDTIAFPPDVDTGALTTDD